MPFILVILFALLVFEPFFHIQSYDIYTILEQTLLITDNVNYENDLPRNFRIIPDLCSGSAQFNHWQLHKMHDKIHPKRWVIVDLRQENHFIAKVDKPYSFNGHDKSNNTKEQCLVLHNPYFTYNVARKNIQEQECELVRHFNKNEKQTYYVTNEKTIYGKFLSYTPVVMRGKFFTEEHVVSHYAPDNTLYKRFFITDHRFPEPKQVDHFINWVRRLHKDAWVHFHCRAGRGRTTTFMIMLDMLKHGDQYTFMDYVSKHRQYGGTDLTIIKNSPYMYKQTKRRYFMLRKFYEYIVDDHGYKRGVSWVNWCNRRKLS